MPTTLGERQIAFVVHEVVSAYEQAIGRHTIPWADALPSTKKALVNVVRNVRRFPDGTAQQRHDAWVKTKRENGWRWGPTNNDELKTHPDLMPWAELPIEDRIKDELMIGAVKCLMNPIPNQG